MQWVSVPFDFASGSVWTMVGLKQTSMKDSLENVARIGCLEFSGQKPLRRPCGTPTRSTPLRMGSSNWLSSLATTQAAGRHCASRLCWTSTSTTHGRKSRSSKTSRGVELSQIVMWVAQQVLDILYMKILKQVMACKPLQWFSFPGSSSLVEKQGRMCAMKYYDIMIIWLDCCMTYDVCNIINFVFMRFDLITEPWPNQSSLGQSCWSWPHCQQVLWNWNDRRQCP